MTADRLCCYIPMRDFERLASPLCLYLSFALFTSFQQKRHLAPLKKGLFSVNFLHFFGFTT